MHDKVARFLLEGRETISKAYRSASRDARKFSHDVEDNSRAMNDAERDSNAFRRALRGLSGESNNARTSLRGLSGELRGLGLVAIIALAQDLITALNSLGGSLVALASSAGIASTALGGLAAAGIAQLVPAIGVLVGAVKQISAVFKLVEKDTKQNIKTGREHTEQLNDEHEAALRVADAARQLRESQRELTEARGEAKRELRDLVLAEREAELAAKRSSLSLSEARENLSSLVKGGATSREIQNAQLAVEEAESDRTQSRVNQRRAKVDLSKGRKRGVERSDRVLQATNAVRSATEALTAAQKAQTEASEHQSSAAQTLATELEKLSPAQRKLFNSLKRFRNDAKKQLKPVSDILVDSFAEAVDKVDKLITSGRGQKLIGSFGFLAQSEASSLQRFVDHILSPDVLERIEKFTDAAARNLKPLTSTAINLFDAFGNVAEAALPMFEKVGLQFQTWTKRLEETSSHTDKLETFFERGLHNLHLWLQLGGAVWDLFKALGGASLKSGEKTLESFTGTIERATKYIKQNRDDVKGFFEDAREGTSAIGEVIVALGKAMVSLNNPQKLEQLADFLNTVFVPALTIAAQMMGTLTGILLDLLNIPVVSELTKWAIAFGILRSTVLKLFELMSLLGLGKVISAFAILGREVRDVIALMRTFGAVQGFRKWIDLLGISAGKLKLAMAGVGFAIGFLLVQFGVAQAALSALGNAISAVISWFQNMLDVSKAVAIALVGLGLAGAIALMLTFTNAVKGLVVAFDLLKVAAITNPFTALAVVLGTVVGALGIFNTKQDETVEHAKKATDALREQTEALRELENISRGVSEAEASVQRARLSQIAAEENLEKVKKKGSKREIQEAKLAVKEARFSKQRAEEELRHKKEDAPREEQEARVTASENRRELERKKQEAEEAIKDLRDSIQNNKDTIGRVRDMGELGHPETPGGELAKEAYKDIQQSIKTIAKEKEHLTDVEEKLGQAHRNVARANERLNRATDDARQPVRKLGNVIHDLIDPADKSAESIGRNKEQTRKLINMLPQLQPASDKARDAFKKTGKSASNVGGIVGGVSTAVAEFVNKGLKAFGAKELSWNGKIDGGVISAGINAVGSVLGGLLGFAGGGMVGNRGERGGDAVPALLGRGEAVLNWAHQKVVDPAMHAFYGFGLGDMFKRTNAMHGAAAPGGFSRGGMVDVPGDPDAAEDPNDSVNSAIVGAVSKWIRKYHADITAAYDPGGGHVSPGHNVTGTATDVVPVGGWTESGTKLFEAGLGYLVNHGFEVLYDGRAGTVPYPNHGRGNHAHIEWVGNGSAANAISTLGGMAGSLAGFGKLKEPKLRGPNGSLKNIAQGATQKLVDAANKFLGRKGRGGFGDRGSSGAKFGGKLPRSLQRYNHVYAEHNSGEGDWGGQKMPFNAIAQLAEWAGMPGITMAQVTKGESGQRPGATGIDPGGTKGLGLWMITTGFNDELIASLGGQKAMLNPVINAKAAKKIYDSQGLGAWYGTDFVTGPNLHWNGKGMAAGGFPDAKGGRWIKAHDGEMVLTPGQQDQLGGNSFLSRLFGFGRGTKTSFDGGGNVGEKKGEKKQAPPGITGAVGPGVTVWVTKAKSVAEGIIRESINTLQELPSSLYEYVIKGKQKVLVSTQKKWEEGMQKLANEITEFGEELSKTTARAKTKILENTYMFSGEAQGGGEHEGGVGIGGAKRLTGEGLGQVILRHPKGIQTAKENISAIRQERKGLLKERKLARGGEKAAEKRVDQTTKQMKQLRKKLQDADSKKERKEIEAKIKEVEKARDSARGNAKNFRNKLDEVNEAIANNIAELYQAQQELFEKRLEATFSQHAQNMLNLRQQAAGMFNGYGTRVAQQLQIGGERGAALQNQRAGLEQLMREAQASGNIEQQERLAEALEENRIAIMENTQELYNLKVEATYPAHVKAMQDLRMQAAGFFHGYSQRTQEQLQIGREKAGSLMSQRGQLQQIRQEAINEGNWEEVEKLDEALEENKIALLENSAEMHKLRMEATFSPHEQSMLSLEKQIAEMSGENFTPDVAAEIAIDMRKASALAKQAAELQGMLEEARREGDIMWAEELEEAILENKLALLQNSKELAELNGTLGGPQEFTTTAWNLFRIAVFNGMGGLLPQFQVPALATGGMITKQGIFELHPGEAVLRPDEQGKGDTYIDVKVDQAGQELDPDYLAKRLSFEMKTKNF